MVLIINCCYTKYTKLFGEIPQFLDRMIAKSHLFRSQKIMQNIQLYFLQSWKIQIGNKYSKAQITIKKKFFFSTELRL